MEPVLRRAEGGGGRGVSLPPRRLGRRLLGGGLRLALPVRRLPDEGGRRLRRLGVPREAAAAPSLVLLRAVPPFLFHREAPPAPEGVPPAVRRRVLVCLGPDVAGRRHDGLLGAGRHPIPLLPIEVIGLAGRVGAVPGEARALPVPRVGARGETRLRVPVGGTWLGDGDAGGASPVLEGAILVAGARARLHTGLEGAAVRATPPLGASGCVDIASLRPCLVVPKGVPAEPVRAEAGAAPPIRSVADVPAGEVTGGAPRAGARLIMEGAVNGAGADAGVGPREVAVPFIAASVGAGGRPGIPLLAPLADIGPPLPSLAVRGGLGVKRAGLARLLPTALREVRLVTGGLAPDMGALATRSRAVRVGTRGGVRAVRPLPRTTLGTPSPCPLGALGMTTPPLPLGRVLPPGLRARPRVEEGAVAEGETRGARGAGALRVRPLHTPVIHAAAAVAGTDLVAAAALGGAPLTAVGECGPLRVVLAVGATALLPLAVGAGAHTVLGAAGHAVATPGEADDPGGVGARPPAVGVPAREAAVVVAVE